MTEDLGQKSKTLWRFQQFGRALLRPGHTRFSHIPKAHVQSGLCKVCKGKESKQCFTALSFESTFWINISIHRC